MTTLKQKAFVQLTEWKEKLLALSSAPVATILYIHRRVLRFQRSVAEGSVAEMCGIEDCDRLIAFGDLTMKTFHDLKQMAQYFENMRGKRIEVLYFMAM